MARDPRAAGRKHRQRMESRRRRSLHPKRLPPARGGPGASGGPLYPRFSWSPSGSPAVPLAGRTRGGGLPRRARPWRERHLGCRRSRRRHRPSPPAELPSSTIVAAAASPRPRAAATAALSRPSWRRPPPSRLPGLPQTATSPAFDAGRGRPPPAARGPDRPLPPPPIGTTSPRPSLPRPRRSRAAGTATSVAPPPPRPGGRADAPTSGTTAGPSPRGRGRGGGPMPPSPFHGCGRGSRRRHDAGASAAASAARDRPATPPGRRRCPVGRSGPRSLRRPRPRACHSRLGGRASRRSRSRSRKESPPCPAFPRRRHYLAAFADGGLPPIRRPGHSSAPPLPSGSPLAEVRSAPGPEGRRHEVGRRHLLKGLPRGL